MTPRQRVQAVYEGRTPDRVPLMLDLSHWYKKNHDVFFDLTGFKEVEQDLVDLHRKVGAVVYIETGSHFDIYYEDESVTSKAWTDDHGVFHQELTTPLGTVREERVFSTKSYSYNIRKRMIENIRDMAVIAYAMTSRRCRPRYERYRAWQQAAGELGFIYSALGYSGFGFLISRYMGVENTIMAVYDHPDEVRQFVDTVNESNLRVLDEIRDEPFDVLLVGDNHDSNVQTEELFNRYTREYYSDLVRAMHDRGKYVAAHVDGEMRGFLSRLSGCGVDCIDACTPAPMFSLTAQQAREEAGPDLILSGGIPATVFGNHGTDEEFVETVKRWLDIRHHSPRLILAAGDQVPTDAPFHRIAMLSQLIDEYGRY
ncbi:MAG: hypothetical protein CMJ18_03310 [Phycisphaeraceae bacterium]|nr:hypothetical protein [Phycisphaeraceae bacterium]